MLKIKDMLVFFWFMFWVFFFALDLGNYAIATM